MSFIKELKRRNVFRVAVLYVVASWLVLQVVDVLSSILPVPDWTGALVFVLLVAGFLPVLIFSWVYELTPEGLKREQDIDRSRSITHETGRKMNVLIVVMLTLAVGAVILDRLIPAVEPGAGAEDVEVAKSTVEASSTAPSNDEPATAPDLSIVVLPFADLSPDKDQDYLADGLTEELLSLLARIPGLRVTSRTSAFYFKGKDVMTSEVAEILKVRYVIEGSVRKSGETIRVAVQLFDASRDTHVWSESWDRMLEDIFAIQDEIAARVRDELKIALTGESPTIAQTDPEAYNLYLRARHLTYATASRSTEAAELYRQALDIDPDYAPAWNGLSAFYITQTLAEFLPWQEGWEMARGAAEQALNKDPQNARARALLGRIAARYDVDFEAAARYMEEAYRLSRDEEVLTPVSGFLSDLGRKREAIDIKQSLRHLDPLNWKLSYNLGLEYYVIQDFETADELLSNALALEPDNALVRQWHATMDCKLGRHQECLQEFDALARLTGKESWTLVGRSLAFYGMGKREEAAEALATLEREFARDRAFAIARIHAQQGREAQALDWLQKLFDFEGPSGISTVDNYPEFRSLRGNSRYQTLLEKAGVSKAQLAAVEFNIDVPN